MTFINFKREYVSLWLRMQDTQEIFWVAYNYKLWVTIFIFQPCWSDWKKKLHNVEIVLNNIDIFYELEYNKNNKIMFKSQYSPKYLIPNAKRWL